MERKSGFFAQSARTWCLGTNSLGSILRVAVVLLFIPSCLLAQESEKSNKKIKFQRCPNAIFVYETEDRKDIKEVIFPNKQFVRCSNLKQRKLEKMIGKELSDALGPFEIATSPDFDISGQGQANTQPFKIRSNPALLEFSYSGTTNLTINLKDLVTHQTVEKLVNVKGPVTGQTYIVRPGQFYLTIDGAPKNGEGFWDVTVITEND